MSTKPAKELKAKFHHLSLPEEEMLQGDSASRNGEFSQLWELLGADREKKLWGIPH